MCCSWPAPRSARMRFELGMVQGSTCSAALGLHPAPPELGSSSAGCRWPWSPSSVSWPWRTCKCAGLFTRAQVARSIACLASPRRLLLCAPGQAGRAVEGPVAPAASVARRAFRTCTRFALTTRRRERARCCCLEGRPSALPFRGCSRRWPSRSAARRGVEVAPRCPRFQCVCVYYFISSSFLSQAL